MANIDTNTPDLHDKRNCVEYTDAGPHITYTWDGAVFCWNKAEMYGEGFCWGDVDVLFRVTGQDGIVIEENYYQLPEKDKDHIITLVCKVKGYPQTKESKKKVKRTITVDDIQLTVDEVFKSMNVTIKN